MARARNCTGFWLISVLIVVRPALTNNLPIYKHVTVHAARAYNLGLHTFWNKHLIRNVNLVSTFLAQNPHTTQFNLADNGFF